MENDLEEKLGAILSNPELMQQIQSMAQSLGQPPSASPSEQKKLPFDPSILQKLGTLAGQTGIDTDQQTLLAALSPYLSQNRVKKLENAMRAAKMARLASAFLGNGGLQMLSGR